jgi:predicted O-methyltransferase YrrM
MSFLSYIFPQEVYRSSSKFSSDIRVIEDCGSLRLLVNGIEQSGKYIDKILNRACQASGFSRSHLKTYSSSPSIITRDKLCEKFSLPACLRRQACAGRRSNNNNIQGLEMTSSSPKIQNMLLLGIGGGSLIHFFRKIYPNISVDAVDIDPEIIHVAKKYFGLDGMADLTIINDDAQNFVKDVYKKNISYGMIVVDLYIGRSVPNFVWQQSFMENVKKLLTANGSVFINVVHDGENEKRVLALEKILRDLFQKVQQIPVDFNTFFLATP